MNDKLKVKDDKINKIREDYIRNKYKFDNDEDIIKSFETMFSKKIILTYKPYKKSETTQIQYLLNKLENHDKVDKKLYNYFHDTLKDKRKINS